MKMGGGGVNNCTHIMISYWRHLSHATLEWNKEHASLSFLFYKSIEIESIMHVN